MKLLRNVTSGKFLVKGIIAFCQPLSAYFEAAALGSETPSELFAVAERAVRVSCCEPLQHIAAGDGLHVTCSQNQPKKTEEPSIQLYTIQK